MTTESTARNTFSGLVDATLCMTLKEMGITFPNSVQQESLNLALQGRDVLVAAQTGSGKTLMFLLPMIAQLTREAATASGPPDSGRQPSLSTDARCTRDKHLVGKTMHPQALVLVPTLELVLQHRDTARTLTHGLASSPIICTLLSHCRVCGDELCKSTDSKDGCLDSSIHLNVVGVNDDDTVARAQILVATPSQLLKYAARGAVNLSRLSLAAIDEVDAVLCGAVDDGTLTEQGERLLQLLGRGRCPPPQLLMVTAHLHGEHETALTSRFPSAVQVRQEGPRGGGVMVPTLRQRFHYFQAGATPEQSLENKDRRLLRILRLAAQEHWVCDGTTLIFCANSQEAEHVYRVVRDALPLASPVLLHEELLDADRVCAVRSFQQTNVLGESPTSGMLVCTHVCARGLDFPMLRHVVMYHMGSEVNDFVHGAGRTARRGKQGVVTCLVESQGHAPSQEFRTLHALQSAPALEF